MADSEIQRKYNALSSNWNYLRQRISGDHVRHRPLNEVFISVEKEMRRLAISFYTGKFSTKSYKVLKFGVINLEGGFIEVRSNRGHTVRINLKDREMFLTWAFMDDTEKEMKIREFLKIGGQPYEVYQVDGKGEKVLKEKRVKPYHELHEEAEKILNDIPHGRTCDPELERLNIRHGINK